MTTASTGSTVYTSVYVWLEDAVDCLRFNEPLVHSSLAKAVEMALEELRNEYADDAAEDAESFATMSAIRAEIDEGGGIVGVFDEDGLEEGCSYIRITRSTVR